MLREFAQAVLAGMPGCGECLNWPMLRDRSGVFGLTSDDSTRSAKALPIIAAVFRTWPSGAERFSGNSGAEWSHFCSGALVRKPNSDANGRSAPAVRAPTPSREVTTFKDRLVKGRSFRKK